MLKGLAGPEKPRGNCRMCDLIEREARSLYCGLCRKDVQTLTELGQRRRHPLGCFCVECQCQEQRDFRARQGHMRKYGRTPDSPPVPPRRA